MNKFEPLIRRLLEVKKKKKAAGLESKIRQMESGDIGDTRQMLMSMATK